MQLSLDEQRPIRDTSARASPMADMSVFSKTRLSVRCARRCKERRKMAIRLHLMELSRGWRSGVSAIWKKALGGALPFFLIVVARAMESPGPRQELPPLSAIPLSQLNQLKDQLEKVSHLLSFLIPLCSWPGVGFILNVL